MARGVDIWAAEIVLNLRKKNKDLHSICASPYEGFEARWSQDWQKRYRKIIKKANYVKYVSPEYSPACFQIRNEYMVNHSNLLIAVYNGEAGGTSNTLNYAKKKDIEIIVIDKCKRTFRLERPNFSLPMFYICVILLLHNNFLRSTSQNYHLMRQLF